MPIQSRLLRCYRLTHSEPYDPESVWQLVQRHSGYIAIRAAGEYWYWISPEYCAFLLMSFPLLQPQPHLDYV